MLWQITEVIMLEKESRVRAAKVIETARQEDRIIDVPGLSRALSKVKTASDMWRAIDSFIEPAHPDPDTTTKEAA